jgi:hypothetical protein
MLRSRTIGLGALAAVACAVCTSTAQASIVSNQFGDGVFIQGDNNADAIVMSGTGNLVTVVDTGIGGATAGMGCNQVNVTTVTCTPAPGLTLDFYGVSLGNGTDSFVNQDFAARSGEISGQGSDGVKTITGGPGTEFIGGGNDSDTLNGGDGRDSLADGSGPFETGTGGNDTLIGGPGTDTTQYGREVPVPLSLTLDGVANDGQAGEADNLLEIENIIGGDGADTLLGDGTSNVLMGGIGADTVIGLGGNDQLFGEFEGGVRNRGLVATEPLQDTLDGGAGRDGLNCGLGFDLARHDGKDDVSANCERTGAVLAGESAAVSGKRKVKLPIECPASEGAPCDGRIELSATGKSVGKGKFSIAPDTVKKAKAKLSKKGAKLLGKAGGSLFVTVDVITTEPGGETVVDGRMLIYR